MSGRGVLNFLLEALAAAPATGTRIEIILPIG